MRSCAPHFARECESSSLFPFLDEIGNVSEDKAESACAFCTALQVEMGPCEVFYHAKAGGRLTRR